MSVKQSIILHCCCLLLALTGCRTQTANSGQSAAGTQTTTSQTTSSTGQASSQTPAANANTAPVAQNSSTENSNTTTATPPPSGRIDACSLITRAEIESAQGEQVTEARSSTVKSSRFNVSQCYYTVAPTVKSVSLELTQRAGGQSGAASPREFWEERFERAARKKGREGEREEEEEEGGSPPVRVTGVGDEAFWVGNRIIGALYVLKGDAIIRISIGGPEAENVKIEKMKALARLAVLRLNE